MNKKIEIYNVDLKQKLPFTIGGISSYNIKYYVDDEEFENDFSQTLDFGEKE